MTSANGNWRSVRFQLLQPRKIISATDRERFRAYLEWFRGICRIIDIYHGRKGSLLGGIGLLFDSCCMKEGVKSAVEILSLSGSRGSEPKLWLGKSGVARLSVDAGAGERCWKDIN